MARVRKPLPWWAGLSFVRRFTKAEKAEGKSGLLYWDVKPTGSYTADIERGKEIADELVQLLVRAPTNGNVTLLGCMLVAMSEEGRREQNGLLVGFGSVISKFVLLAATAYGPDALQKLEAEAPEHGQRQTAQ